MASISVDLWFREVCHGLCSLYIDSIVLPCHNRVLTLNMLQFCMIMTVCVFKIVRDASPNDSLHVKSPSVNSCLSSPWVSLLNTPPEVTFSLVHTNTSSCSFICIPFVQNGLQPSWSIAFVQASWLDWVVIWTRVSTSAKARKLKTLWWVCPHTIEFSDII